MNFFSGLFPVVTIVVFMTSFVEVENVNTCGTTEEINDATTAVMKKCNSRIKDYYDKNIDKPRAKIADTYCEGMKILMNCAEKNTDEFEQRFRCTSKVLQDWVFVSFQYIVISRRIQLCDYDTSKIKDKMEKLGFQNDIRSIHNVSIPDDVTKQCAKAIHVECAKLLMMSNLNLCQGVTAFVLKYVSSTDVANFPPAGIDKCKGAYADLHGNTVPEISKKFANVIQDFSLSLIQQYEHIDEETRSEMMCKVDLADVD